MDAHPLAERFPLMGDDEFEAFKADIQAHGLKNWIYTFEGRILDGRNRHRACRELGIIPQFAEFKGTEEEAAAFVDSQNLHRRHLTAEFRRERVKELRAKGMSLRQIAAAVGVHHTTVIEDLKSGGGFPPPAPPAPPPTVASEPPPEPERSAATPKPPPEPPAPPPKVTGLDGKKYPAARPKPPPAAPAKPTPEPTKPRPQWADVADQLARVASAIEAMGRTPEEESEPWGLVESLERTASVLLQRARDLRRRHRLN